MGPLTYQVKTLKSTGYTFKAISVSFITRKEDREFH